MFKLKRKPKFQFTMSPEVIERVTGTKEPWPGAWRGEHWPDHDKPIRDTEKYWVYVIDISEPLGYITYYGGSYAGPPKYCGYPDLLALTGEVDPQAMWDAAKEFITMEECLDFFKENMQLRPEQIVSLVREDNPTH